jgi:hypothetical protein
MVKRLPNKTYSDCPGFRTEGAEIQIFSETEDSETSLSIIT